MCHMAHTTQEGTISLVLAPKVSILPYYEVAIYSFPVTLWSIVWCADKDITSVDDGNVEGVPVQHQVIKCR